MCTTELGRAAKLAPEFAKRNVKLIALSIDSVEDHLAWSKVAFYGMCFEVINCRVEINEVLPEGVKEKREVHPSFSSDLKCFVFYVDFTLVISL